MVTQKQNIGIGEVFGSSPNILDNLTEWFDSLITHRVESFNLSLPYRMKKQMKMLPQQKETRLH